MPVQSSTGHPPVQKQPPASSEPKKDQQGSHMRSEPDGPGHNPGERRPSDFGAGQADYNKDNRISDNESYVNKTDRSYDHQRYEAKLDYKSDHEDRVFDLKEERIEARTDRYEARKDAYGDAASAQAEMYATSNNNKMHQMFGKESAPPPIPPLPKASPPSPEG